jgi:hypothetical protein
MRFRVIDIDQVQDCPGAVKITSLVISRVVSLFYVIPKYSPFGDFKASPEIIFV